MDNRRGDVSGHVFENARTTGTHALALAHGRLGADEAWAAAHVDEDWNMSLWGRDELALERRAFTFSEMQAAVLVLSLLRGAD